MRMTFGEAVRLVFNQLGLRGTLWLQLGIWIGLTLITLMGFGSIFLSAWGFEWITAMFLVIYLIFVLGVIYSPITWAGISTAAVAAGQPGGEENLSLNDGINVLKRWAPIAMDKMGFILVFCVPVWLSYTILVNTAGYVQENLFLFLLIPTLVYAGKNLAQGNLVFRVVGFVLIAIAVYIVGATVLSDVQRRTTDPAVARMQEYQQQLGEEISQKEADLVKKLIDRVKKNSLQSLTPTEREFWDKHWKAAQRTDGFKKRAETFVSEAKPTDAGWWQAHWHIIIGGAAVAIIALYLFFGRKTGSAGATPAEGAHTPSRLRGMIYLLLIVGAGGWVTYSITTGTGQPGQWLEDRAYMKDVDLKLTTLEDHRVCFSGMRPGKWYVQFPDQALMRLQRRDQRAWGFSVRYSDGWGQKLQWFENVRINGTPVGYGEKVLIGADGCVTISVSGHIRDKKNGEPRALLCPPGRDDLCYGTPEGISPVTRTRFSGEKPGS